MTPRSPGGGQVTAERTSKSSHCHGIKVMPSLKVIYLHTNEMLSGWGRSWLIFTLSSDLEEVGYLGCNLTPQTDCCRSTSWVRIWHSRNDGTTETQPKAQCWTHPNRCNSSSLWTVLSVIFMPLCKARFREYGGWDDTGILLWITQGGAMWRVLLMLRGVNTGDWDSTRLLGLSHTNVSHPRTVESA